MPTDQEMTAVYGLAARHRYGIELNRVLGTSYRAWYLVSYSGAPDRGPFATWDELAAEVAEINASGATAAELRVERLLERAAMSPLNPDRAPHDVETALYALRTHAIPQAANLRALVLAWDDGTEPYPDPESMSDAERRLREAAAKIRAAMTSAPEKPADTLDNE